MSFLCKYKYVAYSTWLSFSETHFYYEFESIESTSLLYFIWY